jgi:hypothetical protein
MNKEQFLAKTRKRKLTKEQIDKEREGFLKKREVTIPRSGLIKYLPGNKNPESLKDRLANKADRLLGRESEHNEGVFHKKRTESFGKYNNGWRAKEHRIKHKGRSR